MRFIFPLTTLLLLLLITGCAPEGGSTVDWPAFHGGLENNQYSTLTQIDRHNVDRLVVAWEHRDPPGEGKRTNKHNPLVIDGILYGVNSLSQVIALDARTGAERWSYDPRSVQPDGQTFAMRGLQYWRDGADKRIIFVFGTKIYSLDARTGRPVPSFGKNGLADFLQGLGQDIEVYVSLTSPGVIFEDLIIMGSSVPEQLPSAPGHIRAFDVRTGELAWTFHTIPQPGEFGYETWPPDAHRVLGGANAWAGMSLDTARGVVYVPTASPTYDFYGGDRAGINLFSDCVLALDARTGQRKWHFQTVHHDLWDLDLACPPNLIQVEHDGRRVDAVAQFTKVGYLFLLDRDTGEPLFPVTETPVPTSPHVPGEQPWPTQPIPERPASLNRLAVHEGGITDISPAATDYVREELKKYAHGRAFLPPTLEGTVALPSYVGGPGWGGAAWSPESGLLVVNSNEFPWIIQLFDLKAELAGVGPGDGTELYKLHCATCHGDDLSGGHYVPELTEAAKKFNFREVSGIITGGRGLMGAMPHLGEEEVAAIAAYVLGMEAPENSVRPQLATPVRHTTTAYTTPFYNKGYTAFRDQEGRPAIKPPWGTLNAIDVNRGEIVWQVPLGEDQELTARGISPTGLRNQGGPVVTASGLVFIAASGDSKLRAFEVRTGAILWETDLPGNGSATPSVYAIDGKQYLVIATTRVRDPDDRERELYGGGYVAYALPD